MSRRTVRTLLGHMIDAATEALGFVEGLCREDLEGNRLLQHGLVRCIEVVGEAAARLDSDYREAHPVVPWQRIIGMRNRLVHAYFEIDLDVVWSTATVELPKLIEALKALHGQSDGA